MHYMHAAVESVGRGTVGLEAPMCSRTQFWYSCLVTLFASLPWWVWLPLPRTGPPTLLSVIGFEGLSSSLTSPVHNVGEVSEGQMPRNVMFMSQ